MNAKKPTRYQRKFLEGIKLDPREWHVQKDTSTEIQVVNIHTKEVRVLSKD